MSTKRPSARRIPVLTAAPLPLLYGCVITLAPAAAARAPVSSVDPSSTTRTSRQFAAARRFVTSGPTDNASLNAGITTDVSRALAMTSSAGHEPVDDAVPRDVAHAIIS